MSYQNYANYGWMLPATFENARALGITEEQLENNLGEKNTEENPYQDWWDDAIEEASFSGIEFTGSMNGKTFQIYLVYISSDDETDWDMDSNIRVWFCMEFQDLYTPTQLCLDLEKIGMKNYSWVTGG